MNAMRDYITPKERTDIFQKFNLKEKFIIEELNDISYRKSIDNKLQEKLENALHFMKIKKALNY